MKLTDPRGKVGLWDCVITLYLQEVLVEIKFQHFLGHASLLGAFLTVLSFSKNNSLTAYKCIKIRAIINVQMLLIGAKMKIIRLWNTSRAFPSLASLRQRISRLGYVICFHIGGYASFLRPRRLAPFLISTYVTPFETLIGKMRWKNNESPHCVEMSSMRVDKSDPNNSIFIFYEV